MDKPSAEMKLWLFDLAHGNLEDSEILSGFIRYYILQGFSVSHVVNDIVYRTTCLLYTSTQYHQPDVTEILALLP